MQRLIYKNKANAETSTANCGNKFVQLAKKKTMMHLLQSSRHQFLAFIVLVIIYLPISVLAQINYRSTNINITLNGTLSLHDWLEKSTAGTAAAIFTVSHHKITGLSNLMFTLPAKSLKSEHKTMDINTYKALRTNKHANITYASSSASITPTGAYIFTVRTKGKLIIAETARETDITGTATLHPDNSITVTGSKKIKMTDYNVTPPTAMLGSIKTGNDLTISYKLKFIK